MLTLKLKLLLSGVVLAMAFASGWKVAAWRAAAQEKVRLEAITKTLEEKLASQKSTFDRREASLRLREGELAAMLDDERFEVESLRNEIKNTPVVRVEVPVPVAGECPACAVVDSLRVYDLYNRAASGAVSDTGVSDSPL